MEKKIQKSEEKTALVGRIHLFIKYSRLSQKEFANKIGISETRLSNILNGANGPGADILIGIIDEFRNLNHTWLMLGEGDMLVDNKNSMLIENDTLINQLSLLKNKEGLTPIPLVDAYAVGGFGSESFVLEQKDIKEYYFIPKFKHKKIDFMIEVAGDSMSPRYNSGDIVACGIIKEVNFIQWNRIHVIATKDQGIILKRIKPSKNESCFTIVADNPDYPPFDIPKKDITGLALVEGGVTRE